MAFGKKWFWVLACCVVSMAFSGCRNRCNQRYNGPFQPFAQTYQQPQLYQNAYGANGVRGPLIAPPGTGTLNIPSIARNNLPGTNQGLLNTGRPAPTPADRAAQFNQQNGWRTPGGNAQPGNNQSGNTQNTSGSTTRNSFGSSNGPAATNNTQPQAPRNAGSVLVQNTQANQPYYQAANGTNGASGYGNSSVQSPDYATTAVNETFDRTRLPVSDASNVRAPSQFYARASGAQIAQMPSQYPYQNYPQQQYYTGAFNNPVNAINPQLVQSQSTAQYDPYQGGSRSADWRNRDFGTGSFQ